MNPYIESVFPLEDYRLKVLFENGERRTFDAKPYLQRSVEADTSNGMSRKNKSQQDLSEQEVDQIVSAQADDDAAWEKPVRVRSTEPASLSIPPDLAARAAFLARLHRTCNVEEWLTHVIQERVELEEAAFAGAKQDLAAKAS